MVIQRMLLASILSFGVSCNMSDKDDLVVLKGIDSTEDISEMKNFEWENIVQRIEAGEVDNQITYVLNTQEIPAKYDAERLRGKYLESYRDYMKEKVKEATSQK